MKKVWFLSSAYFRHDDTVLEVGLGFYVFSSWRHNVFMATWFEAPHDDVTILSWRNQPVLTWSSLLNFVMPMSPFHLDEICWRSPWSSLYSFIITCQHPILTKFSSFNKCQKVSDETLGFHHDMRRSLHDKNQQSFSSSNHHDEISWVAQIWRVSYGYLGLDINQTLSSLGKTSKEIKVDLE